MEALDWQATREFGGQLMLAWQLTRGRTARDLVVGRRAPVYAFGERFKLVAELGVDRVKAADGQVRTLSKFTIAPTLALDKAFWSRPELRFYYTYARWNRAAQQKRPRPARRWPGWRLWRRAQWFQLWRAVGTLVVSGV